MYKIFVDGSSGTTGLELEKLLKPWQDSGKIDLITIKNNRDKSQRRKAFEQADLTVLCLSDDVVKETMALLDGTKTRVLDTSSAHRTTEGWVYGFPEMDKGQANAISKARFVTNPGCFATGAISILRPLIDAKIIDKNDAITIFGVSGYSGGGKSLINKFETQGEDFALSNAFTAYSINAPHKHVKEIKKYANLKTTPIFMPHVVNVARGMIISVAFNKSAIKGDINTIKKAYKKAYNHKGSKVHLTQTDKKDNRLNFADFTALNTKSSQDADAPLTDINLHVTGWEDKEDTQTTIFATLDNLGKGASTQAMQNIGLMLGLRL